MSYKETGRKLMITSSGGSAVAVVFSLWQFKFQNLTILVMVIVLVG
jgi:shikimate 5-dehydrogenase